MVLLLSSSRATGFAISWILHWVRIVCLFQSCQYLRHLGVFTSSVVSWYWPSSPANEREGLSSCLTWASGSIIATIWSEVTVLGRYIMDDWKKKTIGPNLPSVKQNKIKVLRYSHHALSTLSTASAWLSTEPLYILPCRFSQQGLWFEHWNHRSYRRPYYELHIDRYRPGCQMYWLLVIKPFPHLAIVSREISSAQSRINSLTGTIQTNFPRTDPWSFTSHPSIQYPISPQMHICVHVCVPSPSASIPTILQLYLYWAYGIKDNILLVRDQQQSRSDRPWVHNWCPSFPFSLVPRCQSSSASSPSVSRESCRIGIRVFYSMKRVFSRGALDDGPYSWQLHESFVLVKDIDYDACNILPTQAFRALMALRQWTNRLDIWSSHLCHLIREQRAGSPWPVSRCMPPGSYPTQRWLRDPLQSHSQVSCLRTARTPRWTGTPPWVWSGSSARHSVISNYVPASTGFDVWW